MLTKRYRRHAALELGPEIDAYSNEGDRAILAVELLPFETLKLAVVTTRRHPSSGLLAVTDKRLLFVQERLIARPVVLSIPYPEILDVSSAFDYVTGTIRLLLRDESERTFTYISPKERTSDVEEEIRTHLGQQERAKPHARPRKSKLRTDSPVTRLAIGASALAVALVAYTISSLVLQLLLLTVAAILAGVALGSSRT